MGIFEIRWNLGAADIVFRNLLRKRAVGQALDEELESSVETLTEEKMKEGYSQSAARWASALSGRKALLLPPSSEAAASWA